MHTGIYIHPRRGKVYNNITRSMEVHVAMLIGDFTKYALGVSVSQELYT